MIRVLIVDDSSSVRRVFTALLGQEPDIEIVGTAKDGFEAVEMCRKLKPDLVTMDIFMPGMNGLDATKKIMLECPTRIVIVSSMVKTKDTDFAFEAMRAGAIEIIEKPMGIISGKYKEVKNSLLKMIRTSVLAEPAAQMSWLPSVAPMSPYYDDEFITIPEELALEDIKPKIIAIGGSTGAPTVIAEILGALPKDYPIPVIVAQHISKGFAAKMVHWLDYTCEIAVELINENTVMAPSKVFVCPDDCLVSFDSESKLEFKESIDKKMHIPNIDLLFSSLAKAFGKKALGVLLSGMGKDGADGLLSMYQRGSFTICQNEETSVVYGMNKVANDKGAVRVAMSPPEIAASLVEIGKNIHSHLN